MDNRLLSEQERVRTERVGDNPRNFSVERLDEDELLAAQLAKTDKEWVEWAKEICAKHEHYPYDGGHKAFCGGCWQERTKEIGL